MQDITFESPLDRLHRLQQEESERYNYYKEKYTKQFVSEGLSIDEQNKILSGVDAAARDCSVSDYKKLKFNGNLTPTDRYLWISIFLYLHSYKVSLEDLKDIVESYYMPMPINTNLADLHNELPKHRWLKLQDDSGKLLIGPYEELSSELDFSLIRYLRVQNDLFSELRQYFDKEPLSPHIAKLGEKLKSNLILTNISFFQFIAKLFILYEGEVPEDVRTYGSPDGLTFFHSDVLISAITLVVFYGIEQKDESPINVQLLNDGLYSTVKIMQGYCAFVSFCSSLLIAVLSDAKYQDSLFDMMCFFLRNFHNSYIFRIEIPQTPLSEKSAVADRGSKDHTTRMKIYLYNTERVPYVVRVDMPHKGEEGENKLHFNVETLDGSSVLNHKAIDCKNSNPADLLNIMIENMRRMTPDILNIKDSYKEDDRCMLEIMKGFNAYDDLCMAFFHKEENQSAIINYNKYMGTNCKTVEEGILDGFIFFSTM